MRNPLTRLFYIGIFGLGISSAMIFDNYFSKSNSTWEYIVSIILALFSPFQLKNQYIKKEFTQWKSQSSRR